MPVAKWCVVFAVVVCAMAPPQPVEAQTMVHAQRTAPGIQPTAADVATAAREAMASTGAQGLAIAMIDNGAVTSVQAFGRRNAAGDPLTTTPSCTPRR
jgi:hypothetical protein